MIGRKKDEKKDKKKVIVMEEREEKRISMRIYILFLTLEQTEGILPILTTTYATHRGMELSHAHCRD